MLKTEVIRKFFPFLAEGVGINILNPRKEGRIFTDNTASTQPSLPALEKFISSTLNYANIHRGEYDASQQTTEEFERTYNICANLVNAESWRDIILGRNTSEMINLVMRVAVQEQIRNGDNIVVTRLEHNSNYVPWYGLQKMLSARKKPTKVEIRVVDFNKKTGEIDMRSLESCIDDKTKIVSVTGASNFIGVRPDIKKIGEIAHSTKYIHPSGTKGAYFLVDGAQLVPGTHVDVRDIDCDFLAWSFHKMTLPFGVGGLYAKGAVMETLPPFLYGGDMISKVAEGDVKYKKRPWKYTTGTPNILGTIATGHGITFLMNLALGNIKEESGDLDAKIIETELLMNASRGDFSVPFKLDRKSSAIWSRYSAKNPKRLSYLKNPGEMLEGANKTVRTAMNNIREHEESLTQQAIDSLHKIPGVSIYGPMDAEKRAGLVAFNVDGMVPAEVAKQLSMRGVEVRNGTHCACMAHRHVGIMGSVRMSFYVYNNMEDIDRAVHAVKETVSKNKKR